jgi:ribonucleoside-diphosphate reductase alpha chain
LDEATRVQVIEEVLERGSCQDIEAIPEHIRHTFVVSSDISANEHVHMQAAMQRFVDNSISKTCNFPAEASEREVADAYQKAWELGCKGLTVYVTGSRHKVVLETKETAKSKRSGDLDQLTIWNEDKKPRPTRLKGATYQIDTPLGKAFITINENGGGEGQPFEVFITTAKAGSETAAISEAIGRMASYILRIASTVTPRQRMAEMVRQLSGIGGGRPLGFGPNRVLSLPDGVAQAMAQYLGDTPEGREFRWELEEKSESKQTPLPMTIGDLCPECGVGSLVNEEGCRKCYSCGYSEC